MRRRDPVPGTLVVIGNAGPAMWRVFAAAGPHAPDHPLDRWTRRVLDPVATALGAMSYFPFYPAPGIRFRAEGKSRNHATIPTFAAKAVVVILQRPIYQRDARMAASNAFFTFCLASDEHSMKPFAPIFLATAWPAAVSTRPCPLARRSVLQPTRISGAFGTWLRTSGANLSRALISESAFSTE